MLTRYRGLVLALSLSASASALAVEVLGFDLNAPLHRPLLGASRDGAPTDLTLQHSPALANSAAATQQWQATEHWWYAAPQQLPERLLGRSANLQIAVDEQRQPFWLLLRLRADDCASERDWFSKALGARYELNPGSGATDTEATVGQALHYQHDQGAMLISLRCSADRPGPQLQLEYLLPQRFQAAYERTLTLRSASNDPAPGHFPSAAMHRARAQLLAEQSELLLRASEGALVSWLGIPLNADSAFVAEPGVETVFTLDDSDPARLQAHPLLSAATHTLEVDAAGGITRMTTLVPDPDNALQQRWRALLEARFGRPGKDAPEHQIYRFGPQRLVLRPQGQQLRIAYQHLDRRRAERDRLAANKAAAFAESIKGL